MEALLQTTGSISRREEILKPQKHFDRPYDVTLVIKDGKEFKAHRQALSEASPFFEKLLSSEMKENKEGKIRLEMLTECVWGKISEYIYIGTVQILNEDDARDLIAMADYFLITQLKALAGEFLVQKLDTSNCISTYYFAENYRCEELVVGTKKFILRNFATVAITDDFLNMSGKEIAMWISSDEVHIEAEEDVFKIILRWIMRNKKERKKYFFELFRHIRLVYVSRDYLRNDIAKSDLVKANRSCLRLVKDTIKTSESKRFGNLSLRPRKSLKTPLIAVCVDKRILCYFPRENKWCRLRDSKPPCSIIFSCHGQLYFVNQTHRKLSRYNPFSHCWTTLPYIEKRNLRQIFSSSGDEIYALVTDERISCLACIYLRSGAVEHNEHEEIPQTPRCGKSHLSSIMKYKPQTNLWEEIASFDLGLRDGICIIASNKSVYFIGGRIRGNNKILTDVDRYDFKRSTWGKVADVQEPRHWAYGAATHGKVFITDDGDYDLDSFTFKRTCEVYNEATNEWHFVANMSIPRSRHGSMMCADDKIYVLDDYFNSMNRVGIKIHCYDLDKDEWQEQTDHEIPVKRGYSIGPICHYSLNTCAMNIFQGSRLSSASFPTNVERCKCLIM